MSMKYKLVRVFMDGSTESFESTNRAEVVNYYATMWRPQVTFAQIGDYRKDPIAGEIAVAMELTSGITKRENFR